MKEHLLIVDDEQDILDFLERVFRKQYHVHRAGSGSQALSILSQEHIDAIITDQKMPEMTGVELLAKLKGMVDDYDQIIKILLSGYADVPEIIAAIEEYGIHQYVVKPVDSKRLRQAVEDARGQRQAGDWSLTTGTDPEY